LNKSVSYSVSIEFPPLEDALRFYRDALAVAAASAQEIPTPAQKSARRMRDEPKRMIWNGFCDDPMLLRSTWRRARPE
jgi:hypothetical protein